MKWSQALLRIWQNSSLISIYGIVFLYSLLARLVCLREGFSQDLTLYEEHSHVTLLKYFSFT